MSLVYVPFTILSFSKLEMMKNFWIMCFIQFHIKQLMNYIALYSNSYAFKYFYFYLLFLKILAKKLHISFSIYVNCIFQLVICSKTINKNQNILKASFAKNRHHDSIVSTEICKNHILNSFITFYFRKFEALGRKCGMKVTVYYFICKRQILQKIRPYRVGKQAILSLLI